MKRWLERFVKTADTRRGASVRIGTKLIFAFAVLAATTMLVMLLALAAGRHVTDDIELTEQVRSPAWIASEQAQANLLKMQLHVRGYLVLSDPADIRQYEAARQEFELNLTSLQAMAAQRPDINEAKWVAELTQAYAGWARLPGPLFALHDDPLKNRVALRIARVDLQQLRVRILDEIDIVIRLQRAREPSPSYRGEMSNLLAFQSSFDAMATNLMAYATSGELNFKLAYGPQLATNATAWNTVSMARSRFSAEQRAHLDTIAGYRAQISELALQIVGVLNGERAYEDLYLYRTEVAPQAEAMIGLLEKVTARQQSQLKSELARARHRLNDTRIQTLIGGAIAVVLATAMAFVFRRNIVGPVQRLTDVAGRVAAGDLSARAAVESRDEIGVLAKSINTMTQRLAQTIEHLEAAFAEAKRAKDAAVVANNAKSNFLATMSHELRTPLNGILGFAQILLRDKSLTDRQTRGLKIIDESGQHLLTLINDILDLARVDANKLDLLPSDVNLPVFMQVVCDIVRVKAEEKSLQFVYQAAPRLPVAVRVDEKRLRQVLLNLLSNAVKFTDAGSVTLSVHAVLPPATDDSSHSGPVAQLVFEVRDSGIGMSEQQLEQLFEPFGQVAEAKRREGGAGLGLAISRRLVRLMGGDIRVRSEPGQGSAFSFDIVVPLVETHADVVPDVGSPLGYEGLRRKILVVDDVAQNRAMLVDSLEGLGFQVFEAENGLQCIEVAATMHPDLIITDVMMPTMDGYEATRRLKTMPALAPVPIVATSASATQEVQSRCLAAGADAFLAKPVDQAQLLLCMGRLMKLDWIHAQAPGHRTPARFADIPTDGIPSPQDLAELQRIARVGNMRAIKEWAERLQQLDGRYGPFAARLTALADGFESRAIADFVERCSRTQAQAA